MFINIKVTPGAKQNKIIGYKDNVLKIHISAPPIEGKANKALIKFLSDEFNIPKSGIKIIKGEKSREKVIEILGNIVPSLQKRLF